MAGLLLGCVIPVIPQENTGLARDISEILSKDDFEKIVQFVLDNGDRKTYCNMYNNNPHYKIDKFDIYLNPVSQLINFTKDRLSFLVHDYDEITIMDYNSSYLYYFIKIFNERVWIYDLYKVKQKTYEKDIQNKYIPKLKALIDQEK